MKKSLNFLLILVSIATFWSGFVSAQYIKPDVVHSKFWDKQQPCLVLRRILEHAIQWTNTASCTDTNATVAAGKLVHVLTRYFVVKV